MFILSSKNISWDPSRVRQHSFMETDHEIFYTVILTFPLIQEGQFLVKECAQVLVNRLED